MTDFLNLPPGTRVKTKYASACTIGEKVTRVETEDAPGVTLGEKPRENLGEAGFYYETSNGWDAGVWPECILEVLHPPTFGVDVVPGIDSKGEPYVTITITGTTADSKTLVDYNGAEIAVTYGDGQFHVVDYRGADAVDG